MTKKICPIFHRRTDYNGICLEEKCMFWAIKKKSHVNKDGNIVFAVVGGYCLVRDFLVSVTNRE